jgi:hypothetical protein
MKYHLFFVLYVLLLVHPLKAQHDHLHMDRPDSLPASKAGSTMALMCQARSLNLPMSRDGSGTSWQPDATPVYAWMAHTKKWMYMIHGNFFIRYDHQDLFHAGSRGGEKWDAPDMIMGMGQTRIGYHGLLHLSAMISLDAPFAGGSGYPLLFQTGESWQGKPLVDRQHPHDLFSELSASYAYAPNSYSDLFVYVGYPGEPALGPVAFMHRVSGLDDPDAPIGHHWADATHITFGVATLGWRWKNWKLEGSSFTGREPDENRYNFDQPRFDSWSGRLSLNPGPHWSWQVSHGYLKSPEATRPAENVFRTTASATYTSVWGMERYISSTMLWGQNKQRQELGSNDALLETSLRLNRLLAYMRYEWVQKSAEELNLDPVRYGVTTQFPVHMLTLGAGYDLLRLRDIRILGGAQLSGFREDPRLLSLYGKYPISGEVYMRIYPAFLDW